MTVRTVTSPCVSVPVLSNATTRTPASRSSAAPPLISTPWRAADASADISDTGVAITSAHGQPTTSVTSPRYSQASASLRSTPGQTQGTSASPTATATMAGVYHWAKRSMNCCTGARRACASSMRCTMRASSVWVWGRVTRTAIAPCPLMVPANTSSPGCRSTGADSPVMGAWFTSVSPRTTWPSTGMRSPGRIRTHVPTATSAAGTGGPSGASSSRTTSGAMSSRARMAWRARRTVRDSIHCATPNSTTTAAPSAYSPIASAPRTASTIRPLMSRRPRPAAVSARRAGCTAPATLSAISNQSTLLAYCGSAEPFTCRGASPRRSAHAASGPPAPVVRQRRPPPPAGPARCPDRHVAPRVVMTATAARATASDVLPLDSPFRYDDGSMPLSGIRPVGRQASQVSEQHRD